MPSTHRIALTWTSTAPLTYSVLVKPSDRDAYTSMATGIATPFTQFDRGAAWKLDFPTAMTKVRGCDSANHCADSNEQPLRDALLGSVVELQDPNVGFAIRTAISADGSTLAVLGGGIGMPKVDVFVRDAQGAWRRQSSVVGPTGVDFAAAFALSGDGTSLAITAPQEQSSVGGIEHCPCGAPGSGPFVGAVYVYTRSGDASVWRARLRVDEVRADDMFARHVAMNGDGSWLVVPAASPGGRAYVFNRGTDSLWRQDAILAAPPRPADNPENLFIAGALSSDGSTLVLGGQGEIIHPITNPNQHNPVIEFYGFVLVYTRTPQSGWQPHTQLKSKKTFTMSDGLYDHFGQSIAVDRTGRTIAVGAPEDSSDASDTTGDGNKYALPQSGAVYIFKRDTGGQWLQQAFLKPKLAARFDFFGTGVSLSDDGGVVAARAFGLAANAPGVNRSHRENQAVGSPADGWGGAAYIFALAASGTAWPESASVLPPDTNGLVAFSFFNIAFSADGRRLPWARPATGLRCQPVSRRRASSCTEVLMHGGLHRPRHRDVAPDPA